MKKGLKLYLIISPILLIISLMIFLGNGNSLSDFIGQSYEEFKDGIKESHMSESYDGVVVKKYINKADHARKTVILIENDTNRTVTFDYVRGGVYEYIQEGDSLLKKEGELLINLKRNSLDTMLVIEL